MAVIPKEGAENTNLKVDIAAARIMRVGVIWFGVDRLPGQRAVGRA